MLFVCESGDNDLVNRKSNDWRFSGITTKATGFESVTIWSLKDCRKLIEENAVGAGQVPFATSSAKDKLPAKPGINSGAINPDSGTFNLERLSCIVILPGGKKSIHRLSLRKDSSAQLISLPSNTNGVPLERISFRYNGRWVLLFSGILVEFQGATAFADDAETARLIIVSGMNDGRLSKNMIQHDMSLTVGNEALSGTYTFTTATRGPKQMKVSCN